MALMACPDCKKEFSDQAKACPNCARPSPLWRNRSTSHLNQASFALAGLAVVLWLLGIRELAGLVMLVALIVSVYYLLRRAGRI